MKIRCPKCKSVYDVDKSKIPDKDIYAKCPKCQERFLVRNEDVSENASTQSDKMECPHCHHKRLEGSSKCLYCGIVYAKYDEMGGKEHQRRSQIEGTTGVPDKLQNEFEQEKESSDISQNGRKDGIFSRKKLIYCCIAALLVFLLGYVYALPYIAFYEMKSALDEKDLEGLEEHVDFPSLREGLKNQIKVIITQLVAQNVKIKGENSVAKLLGMGIGVTFVESMADKLIDSMVTPTGFFMLLQNKSDPGAQEEKGSAEDPNESNKNASAKTERFLTGAKLGYKSASKFTAKFKNDKGVELTLVLIRHGFTWKLSNIIMPLERFAEDIISASPRPTPPIPVGTKPAKSQSPGVEISNIKTKVLKTRRYEKGTSSGMSRGGSSSSSDSRSRRTYRVSIRADVYSIADYDGHVAVTLEAVTRDGNKVKTISLSGDVDPNSTTVLSRDFTMSRARYKSIYEWKIIRVHTPEKM